MSRSYKLGDSLFCRKKVAVYNNAACSRCFLRVQISLTPPKVRKTRADVVLRAFFLCFFGWLKVRRNSLNCVRGCIHPDTESHLLPGLFFIRYCNQKARRKSVGPFDYFPQWDLSFCFRKTVASFVYTSGSGAFSSGSSAGRRISWATGVKKRLRNSVRFWQWGKRCIVLVTTDSSVIS